MTVDTPIFLINLDRSTDRLQAMQDQADRLQLRLTRVAGINGRDGLPATLRGQFDHPRCTMTTGEIGCYASHLRACQLFVSTGLPAALILEDDVELSAALPDLLTSLRHAIQRRNAPHNRKPVRPWDIVKLCNPAERPVLMIEAGLLPGVDLVRFYRQPVLAGGYLVSRTGAFKLLTPRLRDLPFDMEFRRPWRLDLECFGVCPAPIRQLQDNVSEIDAMGDRSAGYGRRYKEKVPTFSYAWRKMGPRSALLCRLVETLSRAGLAHRIGPVWVDAQARRASSARSSARRAAKRNPEKPAARAVNSRITHAPDCIS